MRADEALKLTQDSDLACLMDEIKEHAIYGLKEMDCQRPNEETIGRLIALGYVVKESERFYGQINISWSNPNI